MTTLSKRLIESQQLTEEDVAELEHLHGVREALFVMAESLNPNNSVHELQLRLYADLLESVEYNMQRVWKFPQTSDLHSWWYKLPHCACPKMDNSDPIYSGSRIISGMCRIHNRSK